MDMSRIYWMNDFEENDWLLCLARVNGDIIYMPAETPEDAYEMAALIDENGPQWCDCFEAMILKKPRGFHGRVVASELDRGKSFNRKNESPN